MDKAPQLFDRGALLRNRRRALEGNAALFLHEFAADEIDERLIEVNRTFTDPAVVAGFQHPWNRFGPVTQDCETLGLMPAAHDLVVHAMGLHWAEDPVGQIIQCRRSLKADGLFLGVLFGGETLNELRTSLAEAEARVSGGLSPRVAPMGEIRDLGALLQRAGLALPVADNSSLRVEYQSPLHLMHDLRAMGETNAMDARLRHPTRRAVLLEACDIYAKNFATKDGRIHATFDLIFLTGWAPSENQQQPLRPGSARARLADALGVPEHDPEVPK